MKQSFICGLETGFNPFEEENCNDEKFRDILKCMRRIIDCELTQRQKQIVLMYYHENMNVTEIAVSLDISPSTVSRSLARSRKNIFRILKYYF
ncbi:MAG: RNA polymerase sigma factor [Oscillospiraceae bacterium]